jgi:hypothetical protein
MTAGVGVGANELDGVPKDEALLGLCIKRGELELEFLRQPQIICIEKC